MKYYFPIAITMLTIGLQSHAAELNSDELLRNGFKLEGGLFVKTRCPLSEITALLSTTREKIEEASDGLFFPQYVFRVNGIECYVQPLKSDEALLTDDTLVEATINLKPIPDRTWKDATLTENGFTETHADFSSPFAKRGMKLSEFLKLGKLEIDDLSVARPRFGDFIYYTTTIGQSVFFVTPKVKKEERISGDSVVDVVMAFPNTFHVAEKYLVSHGWNAEGPFPQIKQVKAEAICSLFKVKVADFAPMTPAQKGGDYKEYDLTAAAGTTRLYLKSKGGLDASTIIDAGVELNALNAKESITPTSDFLRKNGFIPISMAPTYKDGTVFERKQMPATTLEELFGRAFQDYYTLPMNSAHRSGPPGFQAYIGKAWCRVRPWPSTSANLHKSTLYVMIFLEPVEYVP